MRIYDILREANDDSGDYQQMLAFTRANRVGGVPDEQQIPLALFKELKKQQQQNQALGAELDAAEQRIDQATQSGELSKKELGMHRGELDRERAAGEKQQAAVGQLGQQYAEREQASTEQIKQLTGQLELVKNKPGVDASVAQELEKQIKELGEKSVPVDRLADLESTIGAIQNAQSVDDAEIQELMAQIEQAQSATKELEKTKQSIKQDVSKTVQDTQNQVAQIKQDIERLQKVEQEVGDIKPKVAKLVDRQQKVDGIDPEEIAKKLLKKGAFGTANQRMAEPAPAPAPAPDPQMQLPLAESAFARSIAWATGKKL